MYALTLLESCVMNDDIGRFHDVLARNEVLKTLVVKVAFHKKQSVQIRDKVLGLVQKWADAFDKTRQYPIFGHWYRDLVKQGIQFPPREGVAPPVLTPQTSVDPARDDTKGDAKGDSKSDSKDGAARKKGHPLSFVGPNYVFKTKADLKGLWLFLGAARQQLVKIAQAQRDGTQDQKELAPALSALRAPLLETKSRLTTLVVSLEHEQLVDLAIRFTEAVTLTLGVIKAISRGEPPEDVAEFPLPVALVSVGEAPSPSGSKQRKEGKEQRDGKKKAKKSKKKKKKSAKRGAAKTDAAKAAAELSASGPAAEPSTQTSSSPQQDPADGFAALAQRRASPQGSQNQSPEPVVEDIVGSIFADSGAASSGAGPVADGKAPPITNVGQTTNTGTPGVVVSASTVSAGSEKGAQPAQQSSDADLSLDDLVFNTPSGGGGGAAVAASGAGAAVPSTSEASKAGGYSA